MTHFVYLACLLVGIVGLLTIDRRYKLAFWLSARRAWRVILAGMAVFIIWDFAGITAGVFYHGDSQFSLPFTILPEFPLEEIAFLFLLCYVSLLLYVGGRRLWQRT